MKKAWKWIAGLHPITMVMSAILLVLVVWFGWAIIYRLFYQGQDLAKERGNAIVATEQGNAERNIAGKTMEAVQDRDRGRDEIRVVVQEGRSKVNEAYKGETVGADVDRAGANALCGVHHSLCRQPGAPEVQSVR